MSKFTQPVEQVIQESLVYMDRQLDNVKLRTVKGLSQGTSAISGLLLIFAVAGILLLMLSFAFVMWLGELMDSYTLAAFIVAGVLLLLLLILIFCRHRLFKNAFIPLYSDIIMPGKEESDMESLEKDIETAEERIREQKETIKDSLTQAQGFYTPTHLLNEGLRQVGWHSGKSRVGTLYVIPALIGRMLRSRKKKRTK